MHANDNDRPPLLSKHYKLLLYAERVAHPHTYRGGAEWKVNYPI